MPLISLNTTATYKDDDQREYIYIEICGTFLCIMQFIH